MKAIIDKIMHTWWLRHPLFWFAIWNYSALGIGMTGVEYTTANMAKAYMTNIRFLPGHWIITYPLLYLFIPKLLIRRKYLLFTLAYLGMILLVGGAYADKFDLNVAWAWKGRTGARLFDGRNILPFFNMSGIAIAIKFIKKAYTEELDAARSEEQKVMAELELLKAQIHPHFLFNTLNNLFAHTLRNSNDAPRIVLKLSDLLRFMIYDSRQDLVPLEDEIELIRNYIDLEGLRYGPEMNCQFEVEGDPGTYQISPLLIIPLIENAFKHGMSMQTGNKWIHMKMVIETGKLTVSILNSKQQKRMDTSTAGKAGGVGLENVRKRLQLMYPGTHEFRLEENANRHEVYLTVPLERPSVFAGGSRVKEMKQVSTIG
jgi:hypothetical protein